MSSSSITWLGALAMLGGALALAPAAQAESRAEMLYSTHCIACHTTQVHWRDKRLATDWRSLGMQVRRWQSVSSLNWTEDDILEVTRYLNEKFYGYPQTTGSVTMLPPQTQ